MAQDAEVELPEGAIDKQQRIHVPDPNFATIYANHANISFTSWDIAIKFGEVLGEKDGKPFIRDIFKLIVTREFAKALAGLLTSNIKAFEKEFGEIQIPVIKGPAESPPPKAEDADQKEE